MQSTYVPDVGQCLVAKDVSKAVGYSDDNSARRAIRGHVPGKCRIRLGHGTVDSGLHLDVVLLKESSLKLFLMRCHKTKVLDVIKHFAIKIEHCLPASKEQEALGQIMEGFKAQKRIHQCGAGKYRIDLYFLEYKLAVECDELGYRDRDIRYEVE